MHLAAVCVGCHAGWTCSCVYSQSKAVIDAMKACNTLLCAQAAMLGARVLKDFVVQKIESIIDEEKSVKHIKLSEQTEQVVLDPAK
eukprot:scaffold99472_cov31-Tisochrysis_lutea.AAC.1